MAVDFAKLRKEMVDEQIIPRGVNNPAVVQALLTVPREIFVPEKLQPYAYEDGPLPIKENQTISQPYIVALMAQGAELTPDAICLEIGTGSGYSAAILSRIAKEVNTIERHQSLAQGAQQCFDKLGYKNIRVKVGDGTLGWPDNGPFDAIVVTAGAPVIPESLIHQLKVNGRLVIPVGDMFSQKLVRLRKVSDDKYSQEVLEYVRFVPLIGDEGWMDD